MMLGGGFGRRGCPAGLREASRCKSQGKGKPVKMIWSREEDMQHGFYRPAWLVRMKAALDKERQRDRAPLDDHVQRALALLRPEGIQKGIDFTAVRTASRT